MNRCKLKGTGERISEDLTKENYLFWQQIKTHNNIEAAWTRDGIVFAKLKSNGRIKKIVTLSDCQ